MSKVILVTGSNAGIGYELAKKLAPNNVVYIASRNEKNGKQAQEDLKKEGFDVKLVQLDVTDLKSVQAAKGVIEAAEGKLDVLVNNAGASFMGQDQNATTIKLDTIRAAFEPNFFGMIQTTQTFLPLIRKSKNGVILNVSTDMASNTVMSTMDRLHVVAYNTSKAAANSYTIALACELEKEGVKVNCVTPGFTTTKLNNYTPGGKTPSEGADTLVPWALLDKDGPTGQFIGPDGKVFPW
ncbi:NAD(P)-binding protein [Fistulina hepatica ATCC 64428]|uniref:NAD(P)-binding protein n=1 Tax=Fistulina hepatica ATCC 64428 TaxID=1128425 RepID=A0A0D7AG92_9AGAR|nr:NAD(P)-binding protein [Fistulina hepatica ATCC 64428]